MRTDALPTPPDKAGKALGQAKVLFALALAQFGDFGESQTSASMFPAIRDGLGLPTSALAVNVLLKRVTQFIGPPFWGYIADRFSRKTVLVFGTGVWGLWTILVGFSQDYLQFLALSAISTFGVAALEAPLSSVLSDIFGAKDRGRAFGIIRGAAYVGTVLTLLFYSQLAQMSVDISWRIAFWVFGGLSLLSGIVIHFFVQEPTRGQTEESLQAVDAAVLQREAEHNPFSWGKALALFKLRSFPVGLLNIFLTAFPMQILTVFTVTWLVDDRGFTNSQAILFTLVGLFGLTGGSVTGGLVGDRLARRSERARLAGGHIAWLCFTIALTLLLAVRWESNIAYIILLFAVGFFIEYSWTGTIKPVLSKVQLPEVRSTGFALVNATDSLGRVILAALIGAVADQLGLTLPLLGLGVGASLLNLLAYVPLYFTLTADSDTIQQVLAARAAAEAPGSGD